MIRIDSSSRCIRLLLFLGLICCILFLAIPLLAQVSTATAEGTVEDSTGARIPDALVKLVSSTTGAESHAVTDRQGVFVVPVIIPGPYTLQIERQGFATAQIAGLILTVGETKILLIRLKVGTVSETVKIDASGITVNTADASVSTIVGTQFVSNIPLNGRSFEDLITMTPGVLTESPQLGESPNGIRGGVSINGQRPDMNRFIVDGVSANFGLIDITGPRKLPSTGSLPGLTALGTTHSLAPIDALQEFRVLGSNYSAEYGGATGGQFTLLTRSGSSGVHGSLYEYRRSSIINAMDWFTGHSYELGGYIVGGYREVHDLHYWQNEGGATFGFPLVISAKTRSSRQDFVFLSFERVDASQPTAFLPEFVPSSYLRESAPLSLRPVLGDFPDTGIINPQPFDDLVLSPSVIVDTLPGQISAVSLRFDHTGSDKASWFFRYSYSRSSSQDRNLSTLTDVELITNTATLGATSQLTQSASNEFRFGYASSSSDTAGRLNLGSADSYSPSNLETDLGVPSGRTHARAQAYIHIPGIGESTIDTDAGSASLGDWNVRDTFDVQKSHHLLRLGLDHRHVASNVLPLPVSVEADFFNPESLLNNSASAVVITKAEPSNPVFNEFAAFAQDEWRLSKRVTLSPGLRWEVNPPPHGSDGADAYTLLGSMDDPASLRLAPRGTSLWQTSWWSVAPRLGGAWSINDHPGRELVLRTGAGVFFGNNHAAAAEAFNGLGFSATRYAEDIPVPVVPSYFDFDAALSMPYTNSAVFCFPRHFQLPYNLQWNVSLEKALGKAQSFTASWIASNGRRLIQERRTDISSSNPEFGEVTYFPGGIASNYQSMQLKFQRSISPGIQALASYVWSHTIDYGSTAPIFPLKRGNSEIDVRHNFQAAVSWSQRESGESWIHRNLLSGWGADGRLAGRTSFPVDLRGNLFSDPQTGEHYFNGVDLVPGRPFYVSGPYPGGRIFNGGPNVQNPAFVVPQGSASGNAPRNFLRGFGEYQVNLAARRELTLHDSMKIQIRGEAFNLFNHPDLGYIDPNLSDALFGQADLLLNHSFGSLGSLFEPGGPRSLQFSVRFHF